jgi:hypothetical protein
MLHFVDNKLSIIYIYDMGNDFCFFKFFGICRTTDPTIFISLLQAFNLLKLLSPTINCHVLGHFECSSIIFRMHNQPEHVMTFKLAEMETSEVQIHYLPRRILFSFSNGPIV